MGPTATTSSLATFLYVAAAGSDVNIKQYGNAAVVAFDEHGKSHVIRSGKTLIDPKLTNLLSPSAMFKNSDDVYEALLNRHDSHFRLFNGTKIPIRWDGRLFYLDYLFPVAHAAQQTRKAAKQEHLNVMQSNI